MSEASAGRLRIRVDGRWIGIAHLCIVNEVVTVFGHMVTGRWLCAPSG